MNLPKLSKLALGDYVKKAIRIFDLALAVACTMLFGVIIWANITLPSNIINYDSDTKSIGAFSYDESLKVSTASSQSAKPKTKTLRFLGVVPVKEVSVTTKAQKSVFVSGEVFGIKLYTNGVIIVGTSQIQTDDGPKNPAREAGLMVGDIIISINNQKVYTSNQVMEILNENNGLRFKIRVKRNERYRDFELMPVYASREGCYKAGMWVRDSTAGIGTMTYYDKSEGSFGALGHQINDVDTKELMPILEGEAVSASVTGVDRGTNGQAGSLECEFLDFTMGKIVKNSANGIFGAYATVPEFAKSIPVASVGEIKKGKAYILSTVEQGEPQKYEIEITHISYNENNKEKNMVIKVCDEQLIAKTGGIVQGMSGSPIVQNGKLVGAVTHVIVNNPKKGYAIFAQNMLEH